MSTSRQCHEWSGPAESVDLVFPGAPANTNHSPDLLKVYAKCGRYRVQLRQI